MCVMCVYVLVGWGRVGTHANKLLTDNLTYPHPRTPTRTNQQDFTKGHAKCDVTANELVRVCMCVLGYGVIIERVAVCTTVDNTMT